MKRILLSLIVTLCGAVSFAQDSRVASLKHNGSLSCFYGEDAFVNAYNAAEDGDLITLSSGTFNTVNIKKSITIRGASMYDNLQENRYRTIFNSLNIEDPKRDKHTHSLTIENLYVEGRIQATGSIRNALIRKCNIGYLQLDGLAADTLTLTCISCQICRRTGNVYTPSVYVNRHNNLDVCKVNLFNCYIPDIATWGINPDIVAEFNNCIIRDNNRSYYQSPDDGMHHWENSRFNNCIFLPDGAHYKPYAYEMNNCVAVHSGFVFEGDEKTDFYANVNRVDNCIMLTSFEDVFESIRSAGGSNDGSWFLTEAFQAAHPNLGMRVGKYPFNAEPQQIVIKRFDAEPTTDENGKLGIDIEVTPGHE